MLVETDGTNTVNYSHGLDLISQNRDGQVSYYLTDGLGSTRALADGTGNITDTYDYNAYGQLIDSSGATDNSYLYTGEQFDSSLNNYYLRARYYDPNNGRFTTMDTFRGWSTRPLSLNKYIYGHASPTYYSDPSGRFVSLGGLSAGQTAMAVLATASIASYQIGQSLANVGSPGEGFSDRQLGWLILASMAGAGSKLSDLITSKVEERDEGTVDYFRAVDTGEMVDILDCNCFRFYDAGFGVEPTAVKRFWLNQSSAVTFGNKFIKGNYAGAGESSYFVVKATVSQTADNTIASQNGGTNPGDAFIGAGRAVGLGLLPLLNYEAQRNGGIQMLGEY